MSQKVLLSGDEAIAQAALDSGIMAAFAYPGTPATEIMEYLQENIGDASNDESNNATEFRPFAQWCTNEKTAYESALGVSFVGGRTMVSMKHVGLNVAMDPFVNSALVRINGGLVVVVADDPSMHSSQNEQDSRLLADFAHVPCFEPSDQQEAYDMVRAAFDYSETHEVPVMVRIVTRLAHARALVQTATPLSIANRSKTADRLSWTLLPALARKRWLALLGKQQVFKADGEKASRLALRSKELGVVTCGLALAYYKENEEDWAVAHGGERPSHLHLSRYPIEDLEGESRIRVLAAHVSRILVIEEGYPYIEGKIRGIFGAPISISGKMTGELPIAGELSADSVRLALGLPAVSRTLHAEIELPGRPPQFCQGCPHADSYTALKKALEDEAEFFVASDIGCYALGAQPPWNAIESCVDMGASVGMARGAGCVGYKRSIAVIGDSTFYHSGMTNLLDAVRHHSPMTLIILDNGTTGMTGAQPTISPSQQLPKLLEGLGVEKEHIRVLEAHRRALDSNVATIREELCYDGVSVIIMFRDCIEWLKKARQS
ncbi:MAG TPA: thiamine pyrophosphate-dependent enzyme [Rectinema sp.]|nr:thiamine pyrophosphate-dependent enzyme [Rectinema sp.]HPB07784.1 thiamine pyrophosphate-dependent enzyme [Rectinema sp.]HQO45688.1 thiamine pyrophosphate-dependent enzyme [Rectinema sp.]